MQNSETTRSRSFYSLSLPPLHPALLLREWRGARETLIGAFMPTRGIRGATTVEADEPDLILQATRELLEEILTENEGMKLEDIGSALFTVTDDLASTFPAQGARQMGWGLVPMLC